MTNNVIKTTKKQKRGNPNLKAGPGRPKGCKNKVSQDMKEALNAAFDGLGGVDALTRWASTDPSGFYSLWIKMLPKDVRAEITGSLTTRTVEVPADE